MDEKTILDFLREVRHPGQGDRNIVELGMVNSIDDEGGKVTVISEVAGNLIVNVKETRVALSKSMANRVIV